MNLLKLACIGRSAIWDHCGFYILLDFPAFLHLLQGLSVLLLDVLVMRSFCEVSENVLLLTEKISGKMLKSSSCNHEVKFVSPKSTAGPRYCLLLTDRWTKGSMEQS